MKDFNFKVKPIGLLDMLNFKKLVPRRAKKLAEGSPEPVTSVYNVNRLAELMHPKSQRAEIIKVISHGANARTYVVAGEELAPFRAGQYVSVRLSIGGSQITRPYSISSSPKWAGEGKYSITVKRAENGFASGWMIDNWQIGTQVTLSGPEGTFYYEPVRDAAHVIGIAGGSGITPFLSMAYAIRDGIEDFRMTLLYGSCREADILFKDELDKLCAQCDKVNVINVLSEEENSCYEHGFITAGIIKKYCGEAPFSVFMCGPSAMYEFAENELAKLSLERKFIRRELMAAPSSPEGIKGYTGDITKEYKLTVSVFGQAKTIPMKACETVLAALERAGIAAPSRCRGGECGWCRSRLDEGSVFTPPCLDARRAADIATGHIHPCCAYPLSDLKIEIWPE